MAETDSDARQGAAAEAGKSYVPRKGTFAVVKGKYRVFPDLSLPWLDMPNAKAFQAEEVGAPDHKIFALVCKPDLPLRYDHIKIRSGLKAEGLLPLADAGVALWPSLGQKTMILLYDMPMGGRVIHSKTYDRILPEEESEKISKWVRPLLMGINNLSLRGLTHRELRPDNLFYLDAEKTKVVWGDCISCPPAYDQPAAFETIESSMCSRGGRGNGLTANDLYAFGVTLICLGIGGNPVENIPAEELLEMKIQKGSYATLIGETRLSLSLIELLRGLLADNENQRWDISSTQLWADGRRLTPVQVRSAQASQRPFLFNNVEYFNYRTLAYAFSKNWDLAADAIRSEKLTTWIIRGFDDKQTASAIEKSIDMAMVRFTTKEKQDEFFIARTCMLLDPLAPLRVPDCAFMPDALGNMLALSADDEKMTKTLIGLIATGYIESWYEFHHDRVGEQHVKTMQMVLQKPELGMGVERLMYDLNDGLPCQSPLVIKDYVSDIRELLPALEEVSKKVNSKTEPLDRHLVAFISIKFGNKMNENIGMLNSPKENASLLGMLSLFALLQRTFGPAKLYALCGWIGAKVMPLISNYHSSEKRMQLTKDLPKVIRRGSLPDIMGFLDDKQERAYDFTYFELAKKEYLRLADEVEFLDGNREKRDEEGLLLGNQIAAAISFGVAVLTMFLLLVSRVFRGGF